MQLMSLQRQKLFKDCKAFSRKKCPIQNARKPLPDIANEDDVAAAEDDADCKHPKVDLPLDNEDFLGGDWDRNSAGEDIAVSREDEDIDLTHT